MECGIYSTELCFCVCRCLHDYVDIYTQGRDEDQDLLDIPLHGRYCGNDEESLPHLLVSMHNIFIIGFYTDSIHNEKGFLGTYEFTDASKCNLPGFSRMCKSHRRRPRLLVWFVGDPILVKLTFLLLMFTLMWSSFCLPKRCTKSRFSHVSECTCFLEQSLKRCCAEGMLQLAIHVTAMSFRLGIFQTFFSTQQFDSVSCWYGLAHLFVWKRKTWFGHIVWDIYQRMYPQSINTFGVASSFCSNVAWFSEKNPSPSIPLEHH